MIEVELTKDLPSWQGIWRKGTKGFLSFNTDECLIQFDVYGNCFPISRDQFVVLRDSRYPANPADAGPHKHSWKLLFDADLTEICEICGRPRFSS